MNIIIETERTKQGTAFMLIEDDGSQDGGKIVLRAYDYQVALAVCKAMGWTITSDAYTDPQRRTL
ncbi:MAG: hypothetical protein ACOYB3_01195 [Azonexus sp.]